MPLSEREILELVQDGVLDSATADGVRRWHEAQRPARRWPAVLAAGLGGTVLAAGILLFVAANWAGLGPGVRYLLLLSLLAAFHGAAVAVAPSSPRIATVLHAVGTVVMGACVYLAGQSFNLQEHWPSGLLLWTFGAAAGWLFLRQWPQAALLAILAPGWLVAEWSTRGTADLFSHGAVVEVYPALALLAFAYLAAERHRGDTEDRRALGWVGGLLLLPLVLVLILDGSHDYGSTRWSAPGRLGIGVPLVVPLALAVWLRRRAAWPVFVAAIWIVGLLWLGAGGYAWTPGAYGEAPAAWELGRLAWCALGAAGLAAWGTAEGVKARINLGVAGFMITLLFFYFSSLMSKLDRSVGLIGLGLVLLGGGWVMERGRRMLVARMGAS